MESGKEKTKKIPLGPASGETALYSVILFLFLVCGVWLPHRNFHLISKRLGQGGEMPGVSAKAMALTDTLFSWQAVLIILFAVLIAYFWWTSTWKQSMAKTGSRFLLWCIPAGLYFVMLWILYWLMHPLRMLPEIHPQ